MTTRREITANPERWLGTVVEIKHHGLSADGVPRHPQFLRRRDDRSTQAPVKRTVKEVRGSAPCLHRKSNLLGATGGRGCARAG
jgi:hypothetical protein